MEILQHHTFIKSWFREQLEEVVFNEEYFFLMDPMEKTGSKLHLFVTIYRCVTY